MSDEQMPLTGGCNCGAIRYVIASAPVAVAACHCTRCRRQSGAAFSVNLLVRTNDMTLEGELAAFEERDTESGMPLMREFCAGCGSPIRSVPSSSPKFVAVKAGTLDDPGPFAPAIHIWTRSKLPWVEIPQGLPSYPQGPQV